MKALEQEQSRLIRRISKIGDVAASFVAPEKDLDQYTLDDHLAEGLINKAAFLLDHHAQRLALVSAQLKENKGKFIRLRRLQAQGYLPSLSATLPAVPTVGPLPVTPPAPIPAEFLAARYKNIPVKLPAVRPAARPSIISPDKLLLTPVVRPPQRIQEVRLTPQEALLQRINRELTTVFLTHLVIGLRNLSTDPLNFVRQFIPQDQSLSNLLGIEDGQSLGKTQVVDFIAKAINQTLTEVPAKNPAEYSVLDRRVMDILNRAKSRIHNFNPNMPIMGLYTHFGVAVPAKYREEALAKQNRSGPVNLRPLPANYYIGEGVITRAPTIREINDWVKYQVDVRSKGPYKGEYRSEDAAWEFLSNFEGSIVFEDSHLLIVNKPAGIPAHYGPRSFVGVEEIALHLRGPNIRRTNRLDRDTTGIMVLTKTKQADLNMSAQFGNKVNSGMRKIYLAILDGELNNPEPLEVKVPVRKTETEKMKAILAEEGDEGIDEQTDAKNSLTFFQPLAILTSDFGSRTLTKVQIVTGVTHQIRVVSSDFLHSPLVGDRMYNPNSSSAPRCMLHAFELTFKHPIQGEMMTVQAPVPEDFIKELQSWQIKEVIQEEEFKRVLSQPL